MRRSQLFTIRRLVNAFLVIKVITVVFILGIYSVSLADDFHYNNILVGDRASGMGGAYTAVSDDPTGMYYNPAGIVYSTMRNLSASVNTFYYLTKNYEGVIGGRGWQRKSSDLIPNYFGIIQPAGRFKIGFSYAVPDSIKEDQDEIFYNLPSTVPGTTVKRYVINFNNNDNTYQFGPSMATGFADNLSAGLTLYVHRRTAQTILNQLVTLSDGRYEWTNEYFEANEWGIRPLLGLMWSPVEKLSFGITGSKCLVLASDTKEHTTFKGINYAANTVDWTARNSNAKRKYPFQINAGAAYFLSNSLLLSGDIAYSTKVDDPVFGNKEAVMNGAIGTEYYLDRNWAVRLGIFTNMANTHELNSGHLNQPEHIDLYGGSLSLSRFTKNTSVTLGGNMSYGTGEAQVISGSSVIQDASALAWTLFLSSFYSY
jgi:long-chain fatty acid transport protein